MRRIKLTKGQWALVDDEDFKSLNQFKWHYSSRRYASRGVWVEGRVKSVDMHRLLCSSKRGQEVDHINGNRLDIRRVNLRACTKTQNRQNRGKYALATSRFKGVSWHRGRRVGVGLWRVRMAKDKNGQRQDIGLFKTEREAAMAYDLWALDLYGEFARTNFAPILTDKLSLERCQALRRAS